MYDRSIYSEGLGSLYESYFESLAGPILLHPVREREGIIHFVVLEYIQPAVQDNFPSIIRRYITGVNGSGPVKLPGEVNASREALQP